jgi:hypothetical protein
MFGENDEGTKKKADKPSKGSLVAKKDFHIMHNDVNIKIKKGDKVEVPEMYLQNLKTEGVI